MYFPILRGKRNELLALRDCKQKISASNAVIPVIEPVKSNPNDILRCIRELSDSGVDHLVICNPQEGDLVRDHRSLDGLIDNIKQIGEVTQFAYWIHEGTSLGELQAFSEVSEGRKVSLIHQSTYEAPLELALLTERETFNYHLFIESGTSRRYRRQFPNNISVNIQDNVRQVTRNADYANADNEFFSDQHLTFKEDGLFGFGDFSIIGDSFTSGGFQAYVVAIHLIYEKETNGEVWVHRFLSEMHSTPTPDQAGLIHEALPDLVDFIHNHTEILDYSTVCQEFMDIHEQGRSTGLGYIKKLSIKHHIELMVYLLSR